jgi:transposase-like protein
MNKKALAAFAKQAAKSIKSEQDLTDFRKILPKITVESALKDELEEHLGYAFHEQSNTNNSRNGYCLKSIRTEDGQVDLETPRDKEFCFEPQYFLKHRFSSALYIWSKIR